MRLLLQDVRGYRINAKRNKRAHLCTKPRRFSVPETTKVILKAPWLMV